MNQTPSPNFGGVIDEFEAFEAIENLAREYQLEFGVQPYDVSHWDPSVEFTNSLSPHLTLIQNRNVFDYQYSYYQPLRRNLLEKLGFSADKKTCLLTPSGTVSILCIVNLLRTFGAGDIEISAPYYFPIAHNSKAYGFKVKHNYILRDGMGLKFETDILNSEPPTNILWITNPIYCTGVYLDKNICKEILEFLNSGGIVIADEALAIQGLELSRLIGGHSGFIGLYTPHKTICINGIKFSAVVCDKMYETALEQWGDVLYGGIGVGAIISLEHYLSSNFDSYLKIFLDKVECSLSFIKQLVSRNSKFQLDYSTKGHFITCYINSLPQKLESDLEFMREMIWKTGATIIPGSRNHFSPEFGFCFRVNLARDSMYFRATILRLFDFLGNYKN